jgi:predicted ATPase
LLVGCPRLALLITSRTVLRLRGEHRFTVAPLATSVAGADQRVEAISALPAVRLFVERAQAVVSSFALTETTAPIVAAVCRRLDGLPLAIELAAARIALLQPAGLMRRLERSLPLLSGGPLDVPARQQTLRNTLDWSYDLLGPDEQLLFRRLAVFAGGCTLEAAEAVCAGPKLAAEAVLDRLHALLDSSLVRRQEVRAGEPRFQMLETVREYAIERLHDHHEADEARAAHADYFLALAERAEAELYANTRPALSDELAFDQDNFCAALQFAIEHAEGELGLRLTAALWMLWLVRADITEGRAWISKVLALPRTPASSRAAGRSLAGLGSLASRHGDWSAVSSTATASLALSRAVRDDRTIAHALFLLGLTQGSAGDLSSARGLLEEGRRVARASADLFWEASCVKVLGELAEHEGDVATARRLQREALALQRTAGHRWGIAASLATLGAFERRHGNLAAAQPYLTECIAVFQSLGDHWAMVGALNDLSAVLMALGRLMVSVELLSAADQLLNRQMPQALPPPGLSAQHATELEAAREHLGHAAFSEAWASGAALSIAEALERASAISVALADTSGS